MNLSHDLWVWAGVILTLCIFSFLYRDNPFYRFAEHLAVGLANAYGLALTYHQVIVPVVLQPLGTAFKTAFTQGPKPELFQPMSPANFWLIIPLVIGLLYFTRFIPKISWMVRIPIGMFMGYYLGYEVPVAFEGSVFPQMKGTMLTRASFVHPMAGVWAVVVLIGVIGTLAYFFFSREHKGILRTAAQTGIIYVMIGFGASFGFTVMARVSLVIGRFYFLLRDWLGLIS